MGAGSIAGDYLPVAVIIPCYNAAATVVRSVASVLAQTRLPRQLILVDDASSDAGGTLAILHALQRQASEQIPDVEVVPLAVNGGPAAARNAGWARANQAYLAFLDADDTWHPDKLWLQYDWMNRHPEVALTGHTTEVITAGQSRSGTSEIRGARQISRADLLLINRFPTRTVMIRRELPLRFDPSMRRSEDYHLWLRVVLQGYAAWRLDGPLAFSFKEDFGAGGLSGALWKMEKAELSTYQRLTAQGQIALPLLPLLWIWSLLKFTRRALLKYRLL